MSEPQISITLPSQFNVRTVEEIHSQVHDLVTSDKPFIFDGSEVERVDTAALQLLVMCQIHLGAEDPVLAAQPSDCIQLALADLGLAPHVRKVEK